MDRAQASPIFPGYHGNVVGTAAENYKRIRELFEREARKHNLRGVMGVASFEAVNSSLLPVQKTRLRELSGDAYDRLLKGGSVISIAYAYTREEIGSIANGSEGDWDLERWRIYEKAYCKLNEALDESSKAIAAAVNGTPFTATTTGMTSTVKHVEEYYPTVVSHRVAAELSGVGWRGKHELIVNPLYGPALRLSSVLTFIPLERTPPLKDGCGGCRACLDACGILARKETLPNYREQCRLYLLNLGLEEEVCGKCIKACIQRGAHEASFTL